MCGEGIYGKNVNECVGVSEKKMHGGVHERNKICGGILDFFSGP